MDALNFTIAIDKKMADFWYGISPHKNTFILSSPREVSGNLGIPKPSVATFSNFLKSRKGYNFTPEQVARFNALPDA